MAWSRSLVRSLALAHRATIFSTDRHKGAVRGLAWNTLQPSLLASGATDAEIFIWDTKNLAKPYGPSANKSRHLTDITALAWNPSVAHILATASASGSTVVWDLKGRQEVIHLSYQGKEAGGSLYNQGPKPVSSVAWHVERGTRVITACEDDGSPYILVWDLRNYRTPERVLSGHEKGILSLDWCKNDPDLLFSCGKDCRTLAWNPSTGEMVGELPATTNWSFDVASCPRNPSYVATASFDGKISVTSLQSTSTSSEPAAAASSAAKHGEDNAADIFSAGNLSNLAAQVHPGVSLKQAPRWLKRPASTSFGFGGKLATLSTVKAPIAAAPAVPGQEKPVPQQSVKLHQVVTESEIVERALRLENAADNKALAEFCAQKQEALSSASSSSADGDDAKVKKNELSSWKLLASLFQADSREELVTLLGFSKSEIAKNVQEAVEKFKASAKGSATTTAGSEDGSNSGGVAREPLVTFAEQEQQQSDALSASSDGGIASKADGGADSGSQAGASSTTTEADSTAVSDATTKIEGGEGADTEITEPSLFGADPPAAGAEAGNDGAQQDAADFYSSLSNGTAGVGRPANLSDRFALSQQNLEERAGSSVAATAGSRASSETGGADKPSPSTGSGASSSAFRINSGTSEADTLLTRALVLGDFESAVSLCLSSERYADALLLSIRGGPDLLARTQAAYFSSKTSSLPYLRLYKSIVDSDLSDIVNNADLKDWKEAFVVLCTFAKVEEFPVLVEKLGERLEEVKERKDAVLCYLAAGKLEKVVGIWGEEMKEEELASSSSGDEKGTSATARCVSIIHSVLIASACIELTFVSDSSCTDSLPTHRLSNPSLKKSQFSNLQALMSIKTLPLRPLSRKLQRTALRLFMTAIMNMQSCLLHRD